MPTWLNYTVRRWVYGVAVAALPLLTLYGVISESEAPLWVAVIGSIFVPGLAFVNTNEGSDDYTEARRAADE